MEDFLKCLADILPLSWQYPEMTCVRIAAEKELQENNRQLLLERMADQGNRSDAERISGNRQPAS
ncbi:MAG: hypothetical protein A2V87_00400 [Deltaproteobacteria bacterium RBG_16_58_17]|nr:MAG: hypothetical protein A2V87_00400 [Deltaproteobacteria bacterium RBG_16_58_17]OHE20525.1 MAG: hypothetical protein A2X95_00050 [Syntrophobacterales bacterium GWF2_56_9]